MLPEYGGFFSYGSETMLGFRWIFVWIAAIGLALSLWVHIGAVMGLVVAPPALFGILHVGIFVVWLPTVLVARTFRGVNQEDFWKVALEGLPTWARYGVYGLFGYAFVNFALFLAQPGSQRGGRNPPAVTWRGFSGHWMLFYSAALAVLYAAERRKRE
jgi:hypothetical protein